MLAVDLDTDAVWCLCKLDLGPGNRGGQEEEKLKLHQGK
jgi:hypothetical protein